MRVKLSGDELDVIERCKLLATIPPGFPRSTAVKGTKTVLELTGDEIDELRDACMEQQVISGFDEDYGLNALGRVLQDLIDKLLVSGLEAAESEKRDGAAGQPAGNPRNHDLRG